MSDLIEAERPAAAPEQPVEADGPCDCGSGLRAIRCCKLNLARTRRTPPEGLFAERVAQMSRAYNDGERELAERIALEILDEAPGQRDALGALYNVCRDGERFTAAAALVQRLAALYPNDPISQFTAAQFFLGRDEAGRAHAHARMLVRLAPEAMQSHVTMGRVFNGVHHPRDAEHHFRRAIQLAEEPDPEVEGGLAMALRGQGRFDEARAIFAQVLERGEFLNVLLAWASLEEADRRFDAALALIERAAKVAPGGPRVTLGRAMLQRRAKDYDHALQTLEALEGRFKDSSLGDSGLGASALMEKGQILDALGRYDEAFEAFDAFKRKVREQSGQVYGAEAAEGLVARLKDFFTEGRSRLLPRAQTRADVPQPIFIVGFPRSGTTLVEQTLASHPAIAAGDELPIINGLAERMQPLLGSPGAYPVALSELWLGDRVGQIDTLRDLYLNEAARIGAVDPQKPWFTDKMPLNETHLGLISLLFPASPVVHLVRHPLDVVLSVYSNGLTHGFNCASELETAAKHYALIADLIQHYLSVMPINYLPVRYEDLVANQEDEVRRLLDFIGAPFDARTLDFHENVRPARTASYAQVAEKLYDRSRYRYRNYLKQLEPVIPILEPAIHRLGYTIETGA
jgi:tetratricopeptide (TPR) repeat protein